MAKTILFLGNCQAQAMSAWFRLDNPDWAVSYESTTDRFMGSKKSPAEIIDGLKRYDAVIAQPIINPNSLFHHAAMRKVFSKKLIFFPYVFVDGLFSMVRAPGEKKHSYGQIYGAEAVKPLFASMEMPAIVELFRAGKIDFQNDRRLAATLGELESRERLCDVKVVDTIRGSLKNWAPVYSHNHPTERLIGEMLSQVCDLIDARYLPYEQRPWASRSFATLPWVSRALTPYDAELLGLSYGPDTHWFHHGRQLISLLWEEQQRSATEIANSSKVDFDLVRRVPIFNRLRRRLTQSSRATT